MDNNEEKTSIAVGLNLDVKSAEKVMAMWVKLADAGIHDCLKFGDVPHITLAIHKAPASAINNGDFGRRMNGAVAGWEPLKTNFTSYRVFEMGPEKYSVVLAPAMSAGLQKRYEDVNAALPAASLNAFYKEDIYTPHLTLARGLSADQLGKALQVLKGSVPLEATLDHVDMHKFDGVNPIQNVWQARLVSNEEIKPAVTAGTRRPSAALTGVSG